MSNVGPRPAKRPCHEEKRLLNPNESCILNAMDDAGVIAADLPPVKNKKKVVKNALITFLYFFSISIGSLFGFFLSYLNRLPQLEQSETFRPNVPGQVYASDGKLIEEFAVEKRVLLHSIDEISR